jgi:hypothetical protein
MSYFRYFLLAALLSLCSVAVSVQPADIPLSFPFFQSGQSTGISPALMVGYGDWCVASEGLHPGIDLYSGSVMDSVLSLFNQINHFNAERVNSNETVSFCI